MPSPPPSLCSEDHKKCRLKDLFFFRSMSKHAAAPVKITRTAFRRWSFRDTARPGSRRDSTGDEPASAHTTNRSVSKDFVHKKKFAPYSHRIVGALVRCGLTSKKL
ncbi:hypothetical protein F511_13675 [Dorcoceras hygrometricum]|uniref:Uncharacterized protein n=1 Tax=Dorcoceras hygrometricum TaxID=472368 RepID=A0A2Z7B4E4_9LAMI|nr:hypothetical protein F511_13675 [Dorcoceras hygrometricum]